MINRVINLFARLNEIPCPCGCRETVVAKQVLLDTYGPICEYELRCSKCHYIVNYWAYGYYEFPFTRTEQFSRWFAHKKLYCYGFIQGFVQEFKNDIQRYR